jgi:hypothetical protein
VPPCGSVSPCWSTSRMSRWSSVSCSPPPRTPSYASGPLEPCDGNHDDGHELATCPDLDEDDEQEPTQTDEQEPIHASHPRGARIRIGRRRVVGVVVACMVVTLSTSAMHLSTSASASAATNATDAVVAADAAGAAYPSTPMTSASPDATDMTMPPLPPPPPSPSPLPSPPLPLPPHVPPCADATFAFQCPGFAQLSVCSYQGTTFTRNCNDPGIAPCCACAHLARLSSSTRPSEPHSNGRGP